MWSDEVTDVPGGQTILSMSFYLCLERLSTLPYIPLSSQLEPMQSSQKWRWCSPGACFFGDNSCCIVLYPLKHVYKIVVNTIKEGIHMVDCR